MEGNGEAKLTLLCTLIILILLLVLRFNLSTSERDRLVDLVLALLDDVGVGCATPGVD